MNDKFTELMFYTITKRNMDSEKDKEKRKGLKEGSKKKEDEK
jgi:hypothetical protein